MFLFGYIMPSDIEDSKAQKAAVDKMADLRLDISQVGTTFIILLLNIPLVHVN